MSLFQICWWDQQFNFIHKHDCHIETNKVCVCVCVCVWIAYINILYTHWHQQCPDECYYLLHVCPPIIFSPASQPCTWHIVSLNTHTHTQTHTHTDTHKHQYEIQQFFCWRRTIMKFPPFYLLFLSVNLLLILVNLMLFHTLWGSKVQAIHNAFLSPHS